MRTAIEFAGPAKGQSQQPRSLEVILGLLPLVLGLQLLVWLVYLPSALRGQADFRNCYSSGLLLRSGHGHQLYDYEVQRNLQNVFISQTGSGMPYVHPPYEALLFLPFSFLTYRSAYLGWFGLNFLLLLACYRVFGKRLWRLRNIWRWFPFLFFVGFFPVTVAMMQGQDSLITLLLFSAALVSLESGKGLSAGFLIGLVAYKFQLLLPIAGLFLLWRNWRFVLGTCMSVGLVVVASTLVVGPENLFAYPRYVTEASVKFAPLMPVARMPNLRGLISLLHLRPSMAITCLAVLSVAVLGIAAWCGRKVPARCQMAIAISAATLVGYHVMTHDLSILLIPMAIILGECGTRGLWTITAVWLSTGLCFFARDPLVASPILALFLFQVLRSQRQGNAGDPADLVGYDHRVAASC